MVKDTNRNCRLILPNPNHPKLIRLYDGPRYGRIIADDEQRGPLTLSIYRACKSVYREYPSLQHLLNTGAIIPTVELQSYDARRTLNESNAFLDMILPAASHMRVLSDDIFEPLVQYPRYRLERYLQHWSFYASDKAHVLMGKFLEGGSNHPLFEPDDDLGNVQESEGVPPAGLNKCSGKTLEVYSCPRINGIRDMQEEHKCGLSLLLGPVVTYDNPCHHNLQAIVLRYITHDDTNALKNLNRQVAEWLVEFKKIFPRETEPCTQ